LGRELTPAERRSVFEDATLKTRHAKDGAAVTDAGLHDRWLHDAEAAGHAPHKWLVDTLERHPAARRDITASELVNDVSAVASARRWRTSGMFAAPSARGRSMTSRPRWCGRSPARVTGSRSWLVRPAPARPAPWPPPLPPGPIPVSPCAASRCRPWPPAFSQ